MKLGRSGAHESASGVFRKKAYSKKGEGGRQFSMAEGHPAKIRSSVGDVKNAEAGQQGATQMGAENILPAFQEAARAQAAED